MKAILITLLAACTDPAPIAPDAPEPTPDAPAPDLNPRGAWNVTITYGAGTCGRTTPEQLQRVIAVEPFGYSGHAADVQATASVLCDPDACALTFEEVTPLPNVAMSTFAGTWTLDTASQITGSGTLAVRDPVGSCDQAWTATGTRACFATPTGGCR